MIHLLLFFGSPMPYRRPIQHYGSERKMFFRFPGLVAAIARLRQVEQPCWSSTLPDASLFLRGWSGVFPSGKRSAAGQQEHQELVNCRPPTTTKGATPRHKLADTERERVASKRERPLATPSDLKGTAARD